MKKGIYILLFLLGIVFVSCQKQEIVPNTGVVQDIPTWESSNRAPNDIEDDEDDDNGSDDPNGIVDPNNPSDGLKKP